LCVGSPFQVPSGPACASSGSALQVNLIAAPSCDHLKNGLVLKLKARWTMRQHNKNRNFHLINVRTRRAQPMTSPRRPMRPRLAPCGKLVYHMETVEGLPRSGTHSVVGRRRSNTNGSHESAPALQNFLSTITAHDKKAGMTPSMDCSSKRQRSGK
jgi:hypothetical protein